jgi:hypothetical protein
MLRLHQCLSSFPLLVVLVSAVHGEGFTRKVVLHVDRSRRESGREGCFPNRFQQISPSRLERRVMACHSMSVGWRRTLLFILGVRPRHVVDRRCVSAAGIWRLVTVLALLPYCCCCIICMILVHIIHRGPAKGSDENGEPPSILRGTYAGTYISCSYTFIPNELHRVCRFPRDIETSDMYIS